MIKTLHDESVLLGKTANGDPAAFKTLYDLHSEGIFTFSLWYLKSEADAEEIVQEVFMKLWILGTQAEYIENLDRYLKTLTRNKCLDALRRRAMEYKAGTYINPDWQESHNETEERILLNDTRKIVQEAIDLLPQQQKLVYQLCRQQGLKNDEVAEQLNLSPLTVRTHMKLALKSMRTYVSNNTDVAALIIVCKIAERMLRP